MSISTSVAGEIRVQLSQGRREQAIALLEGEEEKDHEAGAEATVDLRIGAYEDALMSGNPASALAGARTLLYGGLPLPYLYWMAKSLEGRALLDLGYLDEAMQSIDPMVLRTQRNQFWWYDTLLTLAWVHYFRGEWREVRRAVVPRLLLCQLPGFGPWFQGQGNFLLGLSSDDGVARRLHFAQAAEHFERVCQLAIYPSCWKAENLFFAAVASFEASGRSDPSHLARAKLLMGAPEWGGDTYRPIREALAIQLATARGVEEPERTGLVPRRYLSNGERMPRFAPPY